MKIAAVLFLAACGAAQQPQPQGVTARLDAASVHEAKAAEIQEASTGVHGTPTYACGDTVLADQTTSGGERLALATPCFDVGEEATVHARYVSSHERAQAAQDRAVAANLSESLLLSCKGIPEREREHSP